MLCYEISSLNVNWFSSFEHVLSLYTGQSRWYSSYLRKRTYLCIVCFGPLLLHPFCKQASNSDGELLTGKYVDVTSVAMFEIK